MPDDIGNNSVNTLRQAVDRILGFQPAKGGMGESGGGGLRNDIVKLSAKPAISDVRTNLATTATLTNPPSVAKPIAAPTAAPVTAFSAAPSNLTGTTTPAYTPFQAATTSKDAAARMAQQSNYMGYLARSPLMGPSMDNYLKQSNDYTQQTNNYSSLLGSGR